jgi:hypothetical protein
MIRWGPPPLSEIISPERFREYLRACKWLSLSANNEPMATPGRWSPEDLEWQSEDGYLEDARESLFLELERYRHAGRRPPVQLVRAHGLIGQLLGKKQEDEPPAEEQ